MKPHTHTVRFPPSSIKSPTKMSFYTLKVILQEYIIFTGFKVLHKQDSKLITLPHSFLNFFKPKISAKVQHQIVLRE